MTKKRAPKGPQFVRFFGPILEALQDLGGSGRPAEVVDWIASKLNISEDEQNELLASGQSRFSNQVHWARFYLTKSGYIDSSKRGVWNLTTKGLSASLTHQEALAVFGEVQSAMRAEQKKEPDKEPQGEEESPDVKLADYRSALMEILMDLPPDGFERLCQRLLRESGFQQVNVTGRSGDGGIDGNGLLQINPFVSFQVLSGLWRNSIRTQA